MSIFNSERIPLIIFLIVVPLSFFYQYIGRDLLIVTYGWRRDIQPISDFPWECRRIASPDLQACEDMWLSEKTRKLFLACSDTVSRKEWMPNIKRLNAAGRGQNDKIIALEIDKVVGKTRTFPYSILKPSGYSGVNGDEKLNLVGITGVDDDNGPELYLINARPSVDPNTGALLDNVKVGGNSTIERFRVNLETQHLELIKTFAHPQIATPNNVAPVGDGSFYYTNDHGTYKAGYWHDLSPLVKNGDVSFCDKDGACRRVDSGYSFPNGLALGRDRVLYVPSSLSGNIIAYDLKPDNSVKRIATIKIPYGLDNIAEDANGDLWVAGLPEIDKTIGAFDDPMNSPTAPATVFRIFKVKDGYGVDKVLEDSEGSVLPGATTVVHDVKNDRLFLSGVVSPFITVCEKKSKIT